MRRLPFPMRLRSLCGASCAASLLLAGAAAGATRTTRTDPNGMLMLDPAAVTTTTTRPASTSTTTVRGPVSGSCTSVPTCQAALSAALPSPGASRGKERRVARALEHLARLADHELAHVTSAKGSHRAHLLKRANHALDRLRTEAAKAESAGILGVPIGPIDAAIASLESLDQSL